MHGVHPTTDILDPARSTRFPGGGLSSTLARPRFVRLGRDGAYGRFFFSDRLRKFDSSDRRSVRRSPSLSGYSLRRLANLQ